jgi:hypothetical protein
MSKIFILFAFLLSVYACTSFMIEQEKRCIFGTTGGTLIKIHYELATYNMAFYEKVQYDISCLYYLLIEGKGAAIYYETCPMGQIVKIFW